jgi:hypothetical protein
MTIFVCWVLFPLVLLLISTGCGLLIEILAGVRLPGAVVPAAGLALVVVATHFTTLSDATAEISVPLVVALATLGIALSFPWRPRGPIDRWAVATALGAFAIYAAPVVLSGAATFTGYIKLDDTATWLAITDRIMEHGRDLSGLPRSSYEATLAFNLPGGYPIGAFLPLGVGHALTGEDSAWVFQPYMALLGAMLATTFYALAAPILRSLPLRALTAFVACQAALLFGYYLWGGVKEIAAAWVLGLIAAVGSPITDGATARSVLPLAIAGAATLAILSFGGVMWFAPLLAASLVLTGRARGPRFAAGRAVAIAAATALLALPSLLKAKQFLSPSSGTLTNSTDLGNLIKPLDWMQFFGLWPAGDFRTDPQSLTTTHLLIAVVVAAALVGLVVAWRRGASGLLIYMCGATLGCFLIVSFASPWVDGKALATASPAFILAGLVAGGVIFEGGRRIEGLLIVVAIAGGVLWSNALAYQDVTLAPRDRLAELEEIGDRFAGQGPALMTDYEPYGVRHFLRRLDPEGASELRRRVVPLRNGRSLDKLQPADIDEFNLAGLMVYRTLVLRASPVESRPPSPFKLVRSYRYYDVWQRPDRTSGVVEHLSLGDATHPTAVPRCEDIRRLAREAGPGGRLAAAARKSDPIVLDLSSATRPTSWPPAQGVVGAVMPATAGSVQTLVHVPVTARYEIWVGGAFRRELDVLVDGAEVSTRRHELSHQGHYLPLGDAHLTAGVHQVALRYGDADLHPGSGDPPFYLGPLVLAEPPHTSVRYVPIKDATSLCDEPLDWVEALG